MNLTFWVVVTGLEYLGGAVAAVVVLSIGFRLLTRRFNDFDC